MCVVFEYPLYMECGERWFGRFWGEKTLSVKVSINKEDFGIVGRFLVRWKFDFWIVKWLKCLILVGFDDMGYDKGFGGGDLGFCLILLGIWWLRKDGFLSWCVDESAIGFAAFPGFYISFCYPLYTKTMSNRYILTIVLDRTNVL